MSDRTEYVKGLRDLADFLEENEDAPLPGGMLGTAFSRADDELSHAKKIVKLPGTW